MNINKELVKEILNYYLDFNLYERNWTDTKWDKFLNFISPRVNDFIEDCIEDYEKEECICFRCNQIFSPEELGEEDGKFFCIVCNNKRVCENCGSVFKFEDVDEDFEVCNHCLNENE